MKLVILIVLGCTLIAGFGCGKQHEDSETEYKYIRPGQVEIELEKMYQSFEEYARREQKMTDQNQINNVIQILIDKGEIEMPYILERINGAREKRYLRYTAYKEYRATHPIDTTLGFDTVTVSLDFTDESSSVSFDSVSVRALRDSLQKKGHSKRSDLFDF